MALPPRPETRTQLAPDLVRLIAPNPSPMTFWGTNTYLLGRQEIAVIDPGPADPGHLAAILSALPQGARITHIFVTHAHLDHSPAARPLSQATGAPIHGFGRFDAGRSPVMQALAEAGLSGGGEGIDRAFAPDVILPDGAQIISADWEITAHWTPGHMSNHMAFATPDALFCGDHVMGWSSSLISPPDGDLEAFLATNARLRAMDERIFHPGHGLPITAPHARLDWLTSHRAGREGAVLDALGADALDLDTLTARVYHDVDPALHGAAARNLFAHLIALHSRGEITAQPSLSLAAHFSRVRGDV